MLASWRRLWLTSSALLLLATVVQDLGASEPRRAANSKRSNSNNSGCRISEYRCLGKGNCLAQDKFCDGENDCDDKSDEPAYCTR